MGLGGRGPRAPARLRRQASRHSLPDVQPRPPTQAEGPGLGAAGDKSLAGSKYLWLYPHENLPARHPDRFNAQCAADLKTGRAWAIKEDLRNFWSYKRRGWGAKPFKRWYFLSHPLPAEAEHRRCQDTEASRPGTATYFAHPITNAGAAGLNSGIQAIRVSERGYRNPEYFRTSICFHLGGLPLDPATP